jgi:hypothetical protein
LPSGIPIISAEDVLHALGRIQLTGPKLLLRVKYMCQSQFMGDLEHEFDKRIKKEWKQSNWTYPLERDFDRFRACLNKMALLETINPDKCMACGGIGSQTHSTGRIEKCGICYGLGKKKLSDSARARYLGMKQQTYTKTWTDIYDNIYQISQEWEQVCLSALRKRLTLGCYNQYTKSNN